MLRKSFNYFSSKTKQNKKKSCQMDKRKSTIEKNIYLLKAAHKILDAEGFFPDEYNELREAQFGD